MKLSKDSTVWTNIKNLITLTICNCLYSYLTQLSQDLTKRQFLCIIFFVYKIYCYHVDLKKKSYDCI